MKIQNNLHLMSTFLLLVFAVSTLVAGSLFITNVSYRLNVQLLDLRLDGIMREIESIYDILTNAGLEDVPKYNESAQKEIIQDFREYQFGDSGMVMIIDGRKVELLQESFDMDFLSEMSHLESGSLGYNYFGEQRYGIYDTFPPWDWTISLSITKKEMFKVRSQYIRVVAFVTLLVTAISVAIAFAVSRKITRSIRRILDGLKQIEDGDTAIQLPLSSKINELQDLNTGINSMVSRIDHRNRELITSNEENLRIMKALHEEEILHREARISALQSQINPHFLYNALECISSIAVMYEAVEIQDIAINLSRMFKYAVSKDTIVTIREEITSVESYLSVQKIRFADKMQATIEISEDVMSLRMMKFIIQPIVENSIYHGLEPKVGEGHITLSGHLEPDHIRIAVTDDGIGMDDETLGRLKENLGLTEMVEAAPYLGRRGIWMLNIHNRILLSYGPDFGLEIQSESGTGTKVIVKLPILD